MNEYKIIADEVKNQGSAALFRRWKGREGRMADMERRVAGKEDEAELNRTAFGEGMPAFTCEGDLWEMSEPFFPKERLIIFGGGHVALPVADLGAKCGFQVTVVDDREEFANKERFPMAAHVICDEPVHAIGELDLQESDYLVIVTRGHYHDEECLRALGTGKEPAYIGMMGSRRRVAIVRQKLLDEGYDPERLARIKSPIGLSIGGVTPEEIAVSIIGEVIQVKRMSKNDTRLKSSSDQDYEVLRILAEETDVPKAVLTVLESHGSSPRGAGAKMLYYADGHMAGSIGGGFSEAQALREARKMIGSGGYKVIHLDMNAAAAAAEGAVCGGVMDVLIEDYVTE